MKIRFLLGWMERPGKSCFKLSACEALFGEYRSRISKFNSCEIGKIESNAKPGARLWLCHTGAKSKMMSSEALAQVLEQMQNSGVKEWSIAIGGADGFSQAEIDRLKPDVLWNFGPATYPHELAAVLAAEQIYRAHAILHKLPYHLGH